MDVAVAEEGDVSMYVYYDGTTEATATVDVRARVTGFLDAYSFEPGTEVTKGKPLFQIDARQYQLDLERAEGDVARAQARLDRSAKDLARAIKIGAPGISQEDLDKFRGENKEADGALKSSRAAAQRAKLDTEFCAVTAPITGKISRPFITEGNLVTANNTILTRIVAQDQMYVYFDVDETALLRYQKRVRDKEIQPKERGKSLVSMGLSTDKDYPHEGTIDFVEPELNRRTGTIRVRGVFENKERMITPQSFAKIRLEIGEPRRAVLIPERAIGTEQRRRFVYVVNDNNQVERRYVELGTVQPDGKQVCESGVKAGEKLIVDGLLLVQKGMTVQPREAE